MMVKTLSFSLSVSLSLSEYSVSDLVDIVGHSTSGRSGRSQTTSGQYIDL